MRVVKKVKVPAKVVERTEKYVCDICRAETDRDDIIYGADWAKVDDQFHISAVEITLRDGYCWPDEGFDFDDEIRIDICADCIRDKFLPWVMAERKKFQIEKMRVGLP